MRRASTRAWWCSLDRPCRRASRFTCGPYGNIVLSAIPPLPAEANREVCMEKSGRALVAAMATVVISFACTLWFSLVRLGAIQDDVALISENATPAIQYLAMARGELLRVALSVTECLF